MTNGERGSAKSDPTIGAIFRLGILRNKSRRMARGERRRAQASLAREVPVLLRELGAQRELLRDVLESIERGDVMAKYARRIGEVLPTRRVAMTAEASA